MTNMKHSGPIKNEINYQLLVFYISQSLAFMRNAVEWTQKHISNWNEKKY